MNTTKNRFDLTVLKNELKELAKSIAYCKRFPIKEAENTLRFAKGPKARPIAVDNLNKIRLDRKQMSKEYRHLHVAYGELRGVPREKMEIPQKEMNEEVWNRREELDEKLLQKIKDRFV